MTFSDLNDAFQELERRADAFQELERRADAFQELKRRADAADALIGVPGLTSSAVRFGPVASAAAVAVAAAVAAVVAVGVGYASTRRSQHLAAAGNPPTHSIAAPLRTSTAPSTAKRPAVSATDVPNTQAALIARFRSILGSTATFTVDSAHSTDDLITGVLTSDSGSRGMYVLGLDKDVAICGTTTIVVDGQKPAPPTPLSCSHLTTLVDGSELKVDPNFPDGPPNGVMNDAILSRPDGWQISLYTANVQGKYYGAPVLGKEPALSTTEVADVVTSQAWLVK